MGGQEMNAIDIQTVRNYWPHHLKYVRVQTLYNNGLSYAWKIIVTHSDGTKSDVIIPFPPLTSLEPNKPFPDLFTPAIESLIAKKNNL